MMFWRFQKLPLSKDQIRAEMGDLIEDDKFVHYFRGLKRACLTGGPMISGFNANYDNGLADGILLRESAERWIEHIANKKKACGIGIQQ